MPFNMTSTLHKFEILIGALLVCVLSSAWLYNRKIPLTENKTFIMQSHVYWAGSTTDTSSPHIENIETIKFQGQSFDYTSTWHTPDKLYYLNVYGKIHPIIGNLAYATVEGKTASVGFDDFLGGLKVRELFSRRLDLKVGQSSYLSFLKKDASGFCTYYFASDNVYCFGPEKITKTIPDK